MKRAILLLRVSTKKQGKRDGREEGLSIPAQREAGLRFIRERGWTFVDEYVELGISGRNAKRRLALQDMLDRIAERRDVDVVVTHKFDRFARNAGEHLTIRASLKRLGVDLVSVSEPIEQNASGKMIEGVLAVLNEHYSDNLSAEVKKGQAQKAKNGGFPHMAPLGYMNLRRKMNGGEIAYIDFDPERAPFVRMAFELYASGDYSLDALATEMAHRGLRSRPRGERVALPLSVSGLHAVMTNKFHIGKVEWNGVEYDGRHEPLIGTETFYKVQDLLASRGARSTRERKHNHYLKGLLTCACGRGLCIQEAKRGRYVYMFCLGMRSPRAPSGCREGYVLVEKLEAQVQALYDRMQLPAEVTDRLRQEFEAEIVEMMARNGDERDFQARRSVKLEEQRRKLMEAYYSGAIDLNLLREEQERLNTECRDVEECLARVDAKLAEWQEILELAVRLATDCGSSYAGAPEKTRRMLNSAFFTRLVVAGGEIRGVEYRAPFDLVFGEGTPTPELAEAAGGDSSNKRVWLGREDSNLVFP